MKQGTFCPGTKIPVRPTTFVAKLLGQSRQPLALVIFAWNFWPEIARNLQQIVDALPAERQPRSIVAILPFPAARVVTLHGTELTRINYRPRPLGNPMMSSGSRRQVMLISHFYNEELLLPYFIRHHAHMFDHATLIDYYSTDRSVEIIRREAPPTWRVVRSTERYFGAIELDQQVMREEAKYPEDWHLALTTTEFVLHPDLRHFLSMHEPSSKGTAVFRFPGIIMVGNDSTPLKRFQDLITQRSAYVACHGVLRDASCFMERYIHAGLGPGTYRYGSGRHTLFLAKQDGTGMHSLEYTQNRTRWIRSGILLKYSWTPWPEVLARKAQIGPRVPPHDAIRHRGVHHMFFSNSSRKEMEDLRRNVIRAHDSDLSHISIEGKNIMHSILDRSVTVSLPLYRWDIPSESDLLSRNFTWANE